jgi:type I restriction enzyme M protein
MFEQVFKSLDDIMFQEPGCNSELDYAEQSSWMLFLKYLDDMENERALEAQMTGKAYQPVFEGQYRWSEWAAPKTAEGKPDLDRTRIGSDAVDFANNSRMAYLRGFAETATNPNSIEANIGQIFAEFGNGQKVSNIAGR